MTTATNISTFDHSSDTGARAWIDTFHSIMLSAGLLQTSDTGQINTSTYTKSGSTNTTNAYSIWKLPDSSLFLKFQYGNGSTTSVPRVDLQVGEGSNGSGTLTGQTNTNVIITSGQAIQSTTTIYASYCCVTNDFFGIAWKVGSSTASGYANITYTVAKTVNSSGVVTNTGYMTGLWTTGAAQGTGSVQCVKRIATAATYAASSAFCIIPGYTTSTTPANSLDSSSKIQIYTHWGLFPDPAPMLHTVTARVYEIPAWNKFSVAMIGSTPHTYLMVGYNCNNGNTASTADTLWRIAMLWE